MASLLMMISLACVQLPHLLSNLRKLIPVGFSPVVSIHLFILGVILSLDFSLEKETRCLKAKVPFPVMGELVNCFLKEQKPNLAWIG